MVSLFFISWSRFTQRFENKFWFLEPMSFGKMNSLFLASSPRFTWRFYNNMRFVGHRRLSLMVSQFFDDSLRFTLNFWAKKRFSQLFAYEMSKCVDLWWLGVIPMDILIKSLFFVRCLSIWLKATNAPSRWHGSIVDSHRHTRPSWPQL